MTDLKDLAGDLSRTALEDAKDLQRRLVDELTTALEESKDQIVSDLSRAFLEVITRQVNDATSYLRGHSTRELSQDLGRFAQRQPVIFAVGAFGLGFWAVRFFRSSEQARRHEADLSQTRVRTSRREVRHARS